MSKYHININTMKITYCNKSLDNCSKSLKYLHSNSKEFLEKIKSYYNLNHSLAEIINSANTMRVEDISGAILTLDKLHKEVNDRYGILKKEISNYNKQEKIADNLLLGFLPRDISKIQEIIELNSKESKEKLLSFNKELDIKIDNTRTQYIENLKKKYNLNIKLSKNNKLYVENMKKEYFKYFLSAQKDYEQFERTTIKKLKNEYKDTKYLIDDRSLNNCSQYIDIMKELFRKYKNRDLKNELDEITNELNSIREMKKFLLKKFNILLFEDKYKVSIDNLDEISYHDISSFVNSEQKFTINISEKIVFNKNNTILNMFAFWNDEMFKVTKISNNGNTLTLKSIYGTRKIIDLTSNYNFRIDKNEVRHFEENYPKILFDPKIKGKQKNNLHLTYYKLDSSDW